MINIKTILTTIVLLCIVGFVYSAPTQSTHSVEIIDDEFDLGDTDAGDIVYIEAGSRGSIKFYGCPLWEGSYSPTNHPVTIINENTGTKVLINSETTTDYLILFDEVKNVHLTGNGDPNLAYGIELCKATNCTLATQNGIVLAGDCDNIEIDSIYIHDLPGNGIMTDWDFDPADQSSWYSEDPAAQTGTDAMMQNIEVDHNKTSNMEGYGIFLGNEEANLVHPFQGVDYHCHMMWETMIHHNHVISPKLSGIVLHGEISKSIITRNSITDYGYSIPNFDQDNCPYAAIVIGNRSWNSRVYSNFVRRGKGHGIYDCGRGSNKYYNNVITEAGFYYPNPDYTISAIHIDNDPNMANSAGYTFHIYNNTIVKPDAYGVNLLANTGACTNKFYYNIIALSNTSSQAYYNDNSTGYLTNASGQTSNKYYSSLAGPKFYNPLSNNNLKPNSSAINACENHIYYGGGLLDHDIKHCNHCESLLSFDCETCNPNNYQNRPMCGWNDAGAFESPYCKLIVAHYKPGLGVYIPKNIPIKIYGERVEDDDFIAICSKRNDSITCGGFLLCGDSVRYCNVSPRDSLGNGFLTDEKLYYYYYDASAMEYIELEAKYDTSYTNRGTYSEGDSCKLVGLYQVQEIPLRQGWSIFSTCIEPDSADIDYVLKDIKSHIIEVRNYDTAYVPNQYNGIGNLEVEKAYKISMANADTLRIIGTAVKPENTPVPLDGVDPNWCLFAYLRNSNVEIATIFENHIDNLDNVQIVKNQDGIIY